MLAASSLTPAPAGVPVNHGPQVCPKVTEMLKRKLQQRLLADRTKKRRLDSESDDVTDMCAEFMNSVTGDVANCEDELLDSSFCQNSNCAENCFENSHEHSQTFSNSIVNNSDTLPNANNINMDTVFSSTLQNPAANFAKMDSNEKAKLPNKPKKVSKRSKASKKFSNDLDPLNMDSSLLINASRGRTNSLKSLNQNQRFNFTRSFSDAGPAGFYPGGIPNPGYAMGLFPPYPSMGPEMGHQTAGPLSLPTLNCEQALGSTNSFFPFDGNFGKPVEIPPLFPKSGAKPEEKSAKNLEVPCMTDVLGESIEKQQNKLIQHNLKQQQMMLQKQQPLPQQQPLNSPPKSLLNSMGDQEAKLKSETGRYEIGSNSRTENEPGSDLVKNENVTFSQKKNPDKSKSTDEEKIANNTNSTSSSATSTSTSYDLNFWMNFGRCLSLCDPTNLGKLSQRSQVPGHSDPLGLCLPDPRPVEMDSKVMDIRSPDFRFRDLKAKDLEFEGRKLTDFELDEYIHRISCLECKGLALNPDIMPTPLSRPPECKFWSEICKRRLQAICNASLNELSPTNDLIENSTENKAGDAPTDLNQHNLNLEKLKEVTKTQSSNAIENYQPIQNEEFGTAEKITGFQSPVFSTLKSISSSVLPTPLLPAAWTPAKPMSETSPLLTSSTGKTEKSKEISGYSPIKFSTSGNTVSEIQTSGNSLPEFPQSTNQEIASAGISAVRPNNLAVDLLKHVTALFPILNADRTPRLSQSCTPSPGTPIPRPYQDGRLSGLHGDNLFQLASPNWLNSLSPSQQQALQLISGSPELTREHLSTLLSLTSAVSSLSVLSNKNRKLLGKHSSKNSNKVIKFHEYKGPSNSSSKSPSGSLNLSAPPSIQSSQTNEDLYQVLQQRHQALQSHLGKMDLPFDDSICSEMLNSEEKDPMAGIRSLRAKSLDSDIDVSATAAAAVAAALAQQMKQQQQLYFNSSNENKKVESNLDIETKSCTQNDLLPSLNQPKGTIETEEGIEKQSSKDQISKPNDGSEITSFDSPQSSQTGQSLLLRSIIPSIPLDLPGVPPGSTFPGPAGPVNPTPLIPGSLAQIRSPLLFPQPPIIPLIPRNQNFRAPISMSSLLPDSIAPISALAAANSQLSRCFPPAALFRKPFQNNILPTNLKADTLRDNFCPHVDLSNYVNKVSHASSLVKPNLSKNDVITSMSSPPSSMTSSSEVEIESTLSTQSQSDTVTSSDPPTIISTGQSLPKVSQSGLLSHQMINQLMGQPKMSLLKCDAEERAKLIQGSMMVSRVITVGSTTIIIPKRLEDVKVTDLKAECRKRKMVMSGPKPNLVERLKPFEEEILKTVAENLIAQSEAAKKTATPTVLFSSDLSNNISRSLIGSKPPISGIGNLPASQLHGDPTSSEDNSITDCFVKQESDSSVKSEAKNSTSIELELDFKESKESLKSPMDMEFSPASDFSDDIKRSLTDNSSINSLFSKSDSDVLVNVPTPTSSVNNTDLISKSSEANSISNIIQQNMINATKLNALQIPLSIALSKSLWPGNNLNTQVSSNLNDTSKLSNGILPAETGSLPLYQQPSSLAFLSTTAKTISNNIINQGKINGNLLNSDFLLSQSVPSTQATFNPIIPTLSPLIELKSEKSSESSSVPSTNSSMSSNLANNSILKTQDVCNGLASVSEPYLTDDLDKLSPEDVLKRQKIQIAKLQQQLDISRRELQETQRKALHQQQELLSHMGRKSTHTQVTHKNSQKISGAAKAPDPAPGLLAPEPSTFGSIFVSPSEFSQMSADDRDKMLQALKQSINRTILARGISNGVGNLNGISQEVINSSQSPDVNVMTTSLNESARLFLESAKLKTNSLTLTSSLIPNNLSAGFSFQKYIGAVTQPSIYQPAFLPLSGAWPAALLPPGVGKTFPNIPSNNNDITDQKTVMQADNKKNKQTDNEKTGEEKTDSESGDDDDDDNEDDDDYYMRIPLKEPPKYDDVVRSYQNSLSWQQAVGSVSAYTTSNMTSQNSLTPNSKHMSATNQTIDDIMKIVNLHTGLPANSINYLNSIKGLDGILNPQRTGSLPLTSPVSSLPSSLLKPPGPPFQFSELTNPSYFSGSGYLNAGDPAWNLFDPTDGELKFGDILKNHDKEGAQMSVELELIAGTTDTPVPDIAPYSTMPHSIHSDLQDSTYSDMRDSAFSDFPDSGFSEPGSRDPGDCGSFCDMPFHLLDWPEGDLPDLPSIGSPRVEPGENISEIITNKTSTGYADEILASNLDNKNNLRNSMKRKSEEEGIVSAKRSVPLVSQGSLTSAGSSSGRSISSPENNPRDPCLAYFSPRSFTVFEELSDDSDGLGFPDLLDMEIPTGD